MLVLGRKPGEYVMIGDIKVQVVKSRQGDLRLAIDAPPGVKIIRGEVLEKEQNNTLKKEEDNSQNTKDSEKKD